MTYSLRLDAVQEQDFQEAEHGCNAPQVDDAEWHEPSVSEQVIPWYRQVSARKGSGRLTRRHGVIPLAPMLLAFMAIAAMTITAMIPRPLRLSPRHQDEPVNERIHQDKHVDYGVEQTKVETLAGVN